MDGVSKRRKCLQWLVCFAAWWIEFITMGLFFSYGTLFVALVTEVKTSKTLAAWIGSLSYCVFHVSSALVRALNCRIGYREIGSLGGLLFGLGLLSSSFVKQSSWLLLSYGLTIGLACGLCRFSAIFALPRYFTNRTSIALGISLSGYGFGALGVGYITEAAYTRYGLHTTFRVLAGFGLILMLSSLAFQPIPSNGKKPLPKPKRTSYKNVIRLLKNRHMLAHCIAFWLYCFGLYIPNVHLVYMAEKANIPSLLATLLPCSMAVAQSLGRLIFGHIAPSSRISPVVSCQITMFLCSVATTLCPLATTFSEFMAYSVSVGFLDSCSTIMALEIIQRILGREGLSDGYALQMTGTGIPGAIGPAMAGFLYEVSGSYFVPFAVAGAFQTSCVCILFLVSTKDESKDISLLEEKTGLLELSSTSRSSGASDISGPLDAMGHHGNLTKDVEAALSGMGSKLPPFQLEAFYDKNSGNVWPELGVRRIFSKCVRQEKVAFIERETVL